MSTIVTSDGLLIQTQTILRDPQSWTPAFVSAAAMAEELDAIRARAHAPLKTVRVGLNGKKEVVRG